MVHERLVERNRTIIQLRQNDQTLHKIGKNCGRTRERIRQVFTSHIRRAGNSTEIWQLTAQTRRELRKAMHAGVLTLVDFRKFVIENPSWREMLPRNYELIMEIENFCNANGIVLEKNLFTLGLDTRAFNIFCKMAKTPFPTLRNLREYIETTKNWRDDYLDAMWAGAIGMRRLEKFALENGIINDPRNVLGMGLSPEATAVAGIASGRETKPVTLGDIGLLIVKRADGSHGIPARSGAPKCVVGELDDFASAHGLLGEE